MPGKAAAQQKTHESALLHFRRVGPERVQALLRGLATEGDIIDLFFRRHISNSSIDDRPRHAFLEKRLADPSGPFASPKSRRRLCPGNRLVVEQPQSLKTFHHPFNDRWLDLTQPQTLFGFAARPAGAGQHAEGTIVCGDKGVRRFQLQDRRTLELRALSACSGAQDGVRIDQKLSTVLQPNLVAPRFARMLCDACDDTRSTGRKKSRGATHDEPW